MQFARYTTSHQNIITMIQRIIDFLISQSLRVKNLSLSLRFFRLVLLLIILAFPTLLCGFLVNFKAAFQMWAFILATIVPFIVGFYLIAKHQWQDQNLAFLSATGLIGFVVFEWSLLGMFFDPRTRNFGLQRIVTDALFTGLGFFILSTISSLLFSKLIRVLNSKK